MFKIGDFSRLGQVSTRMLRHYDQLGLLKPKHTDKFSGYRYYTIDQLGDLNRIIALKELGLSLEQIAQIMNDVRPLNADKLRGMLMMKRSEIELTLSEEQARLGRVEARLRQIELEDEPSPYEVLVKPIPGIVVASVRTDRAHDQLDGLLLRNALRPALSGAARAGHYTAAAGDHPLPQRRLRRDRPRRGGLRASASKVSQARAAR